MSNHASHVATLIVSALVMEGIHARHPDDQERGTEVVTDALNLEILESLEQRAARIVDALAEARLVGWATSDVAHANGVVAGVLRSRLVGAALHSAGKGETAAVRLDPPGLAPGQQGIPVEVFAVHVIPTSRYVAWCVDRKDAEALQDRHGGERCIIDRATIVSVDQNTPRAPDALDPDLQRVQDQINAVAAERRQTLAPVRESAEAYADEVMASTGSVRGMVSVEAVRRDLVGAYVAGAKGRRERFDAATERVFAEHDGLFRRLSEAERSECPNVETAMAKARQVLDREVGLACLDTMQWEVTVDGQTVCVGDTPVETMAHALREMASQLDSMAGPVPARDADLLRQWATTLGGMVASADPVARQDGAG